MRKNLKLMWKWALVSLSTVLLLVGLSACSLFQGQSIDGNWTSPSAAKEMYAEMLSVAGSEEAFAYSGHKFEEIISKSEVNLHVQNDKAVFEVVLFVDAEVFFTALKDEQEAIMQEELKKAGYNYEELSPELKKEVDASLLSPDEEIRQMVQTIIDEMTKTMDGTYAADNGVIFTKVFEADVNRTGETFDITEAGKIFGEELVEEGESYEYTYKDGVLTLKGEKSEDDIVFEKKK